MFTNELSLVLRPHTNHFSCFFLLLRLILRRKKDVSEEDYSWQCPKKKDIATSLC